MDNLLNYFIKEPEREFYVRELAKFTKKSPTTISKYLNKLKKDKLLISKKKYNHLLFKANTEDQVFKDLKLFYNIKKLRECGLIDYLIEEFNHPEAITLFGSFRKAENIPKSDIDILIITPLKKKIDLKKFEKILNHEIQLFLHSNEEIEKMKIQNKDLINNWINGIVVYGYWGLYK